jgi:hypothetical protein
MNIPMKSEKVKRGINGGKIKPHKEVQACVKNTGVALDSVGGRLKIRVRPLVLRSEQRSPDIA